MLIYLPGAQSLKPQGHLSEGMRNQQIDSVYALVLDSLGP